MEIESSAFIDADLDTFLAECRTHEQRDLAERLEAASARLAALIGRMAGADSNPTEGWSAPEILAHVAGFSKYFGVLAYRVGSGKVADVDLLADIRQRDAVMQGLMARSPAELLAAAQASHRQTLDWLRAARPAALSRRTDVGAGRTLSAEEILRLGLCAHLEIHLDQLEQALT
ncbi:MAG: DinB family protein [Chloroflexota bacterium]|nr:DinB family protein [Chloroflexota bacterium]